MKNACVNIFPLLTTFVTLLFSAAPALADWNDCPSHDNGYNYYFNDPLDVIVNAQSEAEANALCAKYAKNNNTAGGFGLYCNKCPIGGEFDCDCCEVVNDDKAEEQKKENQKGIKGNGGSGGGTASQ